jgi:hypothetical protein
MRDQRSTFATPFCQRGCSLSVLLVDLVDEEIGDTVMWLYVNGAPWCVVDTTPEVEVASLLTEKSGGEVAVFRC